MNREKGAGGREHGLQRRDFLKVMGASVALAGLDGCNRLPAEKILPYVMEPPELTPGVATRYATAMVLDGYATGLIVEAHEGRPTKIEGNPLHPASLGAAGVLEQASVLQLYDPDRGRFGTHGWSSIAAALAPNTLRGRVGGRGERLRILLEPTSSLVVADLVAQLRTLYPAAGIHFYSPFPYQARTASTNGEPTVDVYDLSTADVVVAIDSDFLNSGPFALRYARQFADRRRNPAQRMNRLYVLEPGVTVTGQSADHRFAMSLASIEQSIGALQAAFEQQVVPNSTLLPIVHDLQLNRGRSVVIAGSRLSPSARAVCAQVNQALGNTGRTVTTVPSSLLGAGDPAHGIAALLAALESKSVDTLVMLGGNPSYSLPGIGDLIRAVPNSFYLGVHENETARDAKVYVPESHYLETWSDARALDGTPTPIQPLVQPLFAAKSAVEVLSAMTGSANADARALLAATWKRHGLAADDTAFASALRRGIVASPSLAPPPSQLNTLAARNSQPSTNSSPTGLEVIITPDNRIHDGRFSNNGWLQELPDPITKLTWDHAALVSPATARQLNASTGDIVTIKSPVTNQSVSVPILEVPGQADGVVVLSAGYGRSGAEHLARDRGVNAFVLAKPDQFVIDGCDVRRSGGSRTLAITQKHWQMNGVQALAMTLPEAKAKPPQRRRRALTLYEPTPPGGEAPQQWAMTIDLSLCTGCSACVVACQAENNIAVVGPDDVEKSREMHWLRIDRYAQTDGSGVVTQPMLCQQCEKAPCEYVCPVEATEHSADGLNEMVYNRCVGTRFCSNNCPYKVRRFNWFDYNAELSEVERMVKNPNVTVRERGVMEKCTFCVQRIRGAEIEARGRHEPLDPKVVQTACQQACPTRAILFGSLTDPSSPVVAQREDPRAYRVLDELGTEPRVTYLAKVRNPNGI